ncbi:MAG: prolipoprotein diacylglyceryl transferase [Candidatus Omnitrophica bacterium]|jgi:phosphatidylglycerol:prolipoprotein diacylglycerol transferase|nr:prolipoprotein diacylglyceryl transferase [Candidatus Omnitrophota bacterium]
MNRILFHLGPLKVYSYGFMLAFAFVLGTILAQSRARKQGIDPNKITDLIFYILVSSIAGARFLYVAVNWQYYKSALMDIFKVWEGGLIFYGGFILALIVAIWFMRRNRLPAWEITDIMAPSVALGIALGRIGCFLNGCCYGIISQRWGLSFPARDNPPVFAQQIADGLIQPQAVCSLPVIPAQLYAALHGLLIFAILIILERKKRFAGFQFWVLVLLYSLGRFFIESFRYYERPYMAGSLTISQIISVVLFSASAFVLIARSKNARN